MVDIGHRIAGIPCGRWSKWLVLAFSVGVLAVAVPLAGKLGDILQNDSSAYLPDNAESTKVINLQAQFQKNPTIAALIVYERQDGIVDSDMSKAAADAVAVAKVTNGDASVARVTPPTKSADGKAIGYTIDIANVAKDTELVTDMVKQFRTIIDTDVPGLEVHIAGRAGKLADSSEAFTKASAAVEYATIGVIIFLLLLTYRSPILWLLPIVSASASLYAARGAIYLTAKYFDLTVNGQSESILTVIVFGVGTDYALLLIARYREELRRHQDRHHAMKCALRGVGEAIIASASTVALAMLCLLAAEMNSTRGMGPVVAIGVMVALVIMTTLLPALLVVFGRWIFWPLRPLAGTPEPTERGIWFRMGHAIDRRPRRIWMATTLALGALALGIFSLHPGVLQAKDSYTTTPDSVKGDETLARHFAGGQDQPMVVICKAASATQVAERLGQVDGIVTVRKPLTQGDYSYIEGVFRDAVDSSEARETLLRARSAVAELPEAEALIGGSTAISNDSAEISRRDNKVVIPLTLVVVTIILGALLRSLVAPFMLIATVILSFATTLGISALSFEHLFKFNGVDTSFPLLVFVFLTSLGIDYNIFLMSRVREESVGFVTRKGTIVALAATGGVITSAGMVLAGSFAVLATLSLVTLAELGFAISVGVLIDTLIVRSVLVTAITLDIRGMIWWPSKLAKPRHGLWGGRRLHPQRAIPVDIIPTDTAGPWRPESLTLPTYHVQEKKLASLNNVSASIKE